MFGVLGRAGLASTAAQVLGEMLLQSQEAAPLAVGPVPPHHHLWPVPAAGRSFMFGKLPAQRVAPTEPDPQFYFWAG